MVMNTRLVCYNSLWLILFNWAVMRNDLQIDSDLKRQRDISEGE